MTLPSDPKLAKLQSFHGRAAISNRAARDKEQQAQRIEDDARQELYDYIRRLGYCPHCELPLSECTGHGQIFDRRHGDRRRPADNAESQSA